MLETIKLYLHCVVQFLEIGFLTFLFFFSDGVQKRIKCPILHICSIPP